jgi:hypothetical protein
MDKPKDREKPGQKNQSISLDLQRWRIQHPA